MIKDGKTYYSASYIVNRLSKKYNANRIWLWDMLEEEFNIIKGTGGMMNILEIREFEYMVKNGLE